MAKRENYSLWFCPLPFCPFALLPFCPFALLPFCPFAPLPFCPHFIALAPAMALFKFLRLSREDIFCFCFHISVHVQISSTLLILLLPAKMTIKTLFFRRQTTSMPFLAANVEALSKHLKAWRWTKSRCRTSWDLK